MKYIWEVTDIIFIKIIKNLFRKRFNFIQLNTYDHKKLDSRVLIKVYYPLIRFAGFIKTVNNDCRLKGTFFDCSNPSREFQALSHSL